MVGPDYTIVHWDERMEALSGGLSEETLGKPCYEAVMGEGEKGQPFCAHGCSVMHLAREGRPVSSYDMRIKTRSGRRRWVSASTLTVETEEGPYLGGELYLSQATVRNHIRALLEAIRAHSQLEALAKATQFGIL